MSLVMCEEWVPGFLTMVGTRSGLALEGFPVIEKKKRIASYIEFTFLR